MSEGIIKFEAGGKEVQPQAFFLLESYDRKFLPDVEGTNET